MKNKNSNNKLQDAAGIFIFLRLQNLQPEFFSSRCCCSFSFSLSPCLSLSLTSQHLQLPNARRHCISKRTKQSSALAQQRTQQSRRSASEHESFSTELHPSFIYSFTRSFTGSSSFSFIHFIIHSLGKSHSFILLIR